MVAAEEPARGRKNSAAPARMAARRSPGCSPRRRSMCSIITMASSMTRPMAAAMPPSVMMLKLWPSNLSARVVMASTAGTTTTATAVMCRLRRKTSRTSAASTAPMAMAAAKPWAEDLINSLWSYQPETRRPGGAVALTLAKTAATSRTMRTVSPLGC